MLGRGGKSLEIEGGLDSRKSLDPCNNTEAAEGLEGRSGKDCKLGDGDGW